MRVRDIMTSPAQVIRPDAPVEAAADLMTTYAVTALPVVGDGERLIGMVSDSDLLWHRVPAEPGTDPTEHLDAVVHPGRRPGVVVEVMSEHPISIGPGADVADAAQLMLDHDVRSLPVLDDGEVIGIVSRRDILRAVVRDDRVLAADVRRRLDDYAGRQGRWTVVVESGVVTVGGDFPNDQQRSVVSLLSSTVPGVAEVHLDDESAPADAYVLTLLGQPHTGT